MYNFFIFLSKLVVFCIVAIIALKIFFTLLGITIGLIALSIKVSILFAVMYGIYYIFKKITETGTENR